VQRDWLVVVKPRVKLEIVYFILSLATTESGERKLSKEKFSPEFVGGVQLQSALMGLTLAFKKKYGDDAVKVTETFVEQMGTMMGNNFKERGDVKGSGIKEIERVFRIWLDPSTAPHKMKTSMDGSKLTVNRESPVLCPAIVVARQMNLPLEMVCNTVAFPMFKGVAKAVNSKAKTSNIQRSENKCIDRIEIP